MLFENVFNILLKRKRILTKYSKVIIFKINYSTKNKILNIEFKRDNISAHSPW